MNQTNSKSENSELSAIQAWAKLVDTGKAPVYVATGVPVADNRDQHISASSMSIKQL